MLEGPKACGKTWTAQQAAASEVLLDTDKTGEPTVLGIIITTTYGYVRNDGVTVILVAAVCSAHPGAPCYSDWCIDQRG